MPLVIRTCARVYPKSEYSIQNALKSWVGRKKKVQMIVLFVQQKPSSDDHRLWIQDDSNVRRMQ